MYIFMYFIKAKIHKYRFINNNSDTKFISEYSQTQRYRKRKWQIHDLRTLKFAFSSKPQFIFIFILFHIHTPPHLYIFLFLYISLFAVTTPSFPISFFPSSCPILCFAQNCFVLLQATLYFKLYIHQFLLSFFFHCSFIFCSDYNIRPLHRVT